MEILKKMIEEVSDKFIKEINEEFNKWLFQAEKVIEKTMNETLIKIKEIQAEYKRKSEFLKSTIISNTEIQIKNLFLNLINENIDNIISLALNKIKEKQFKEKYNSSLKKMLEESVDYINEKNIIVYCNEKDYPVLKKYTEEISKRKNMNIKLIKKDISKIGGIIVSNESGSLTFNNTIEARLIRLKDNIRKIIADILLEE